MRIQFDQLLSYSDEEFSDVENSSTTTTSSLNKDDYTFINEDEESSGVPHLYLPKTINTDKFPIKVSSENDNQAIVLLNKSKVKSSKKDSLKETTIDPEITELLERLNLKSKLPSRYDRQPTKIVKELKYQPLYLTCNSETSTNDDTSLDNNTSQTNVDTTSVSDTLHSINDSFLKKLRSLELENKNQVNIAKDRKRKEEEEERKRKEEVERKHREEVERKHKEQEQERKRKEEEELRIKKEKLARQKQLEEEERQKAETIRLKKAEEEEALSKAKLAKEQEDKLKKEAAEASAKKEQSNRTNTKGKFTTDFNSVEQVFKKYKDKINSIKTEIVQPVKKADVNTRNTLSRHKRKINPKFGQLTNSLQQLTNVQNELCSLIDQTKPHELSYLWILNFISKAIVHQAETEVRVKPESAVPLAKLTLYLLVRYPELKELLMARFVKKCPFVIGYTCNIDTEDGRLRMGWKRKSDNKWEEETSYDERLGGMTTLFSVITRLPLAPEFINTQEHPLPISYSWRMVARIANTNLKLITNSHFVVLGCWWDAAASQFIQAYSRQAQKLLFLIANDLTGALSQHKYVGAARLLILFEEWQRGAIKTFPDMIA
ncbi:hypothetical protein TBLA_0A01720 [Henningerozyma blattae CBS 6284]|uniref:mRNA export factor GLE1 n=1 Tax=Henningerozyma blattae (strain ATCC 34711 / CBS 6284 / DSM 70876 / NBRC 10599 / NRRL Y-10934 / UCD 77-7) TaxID=1071380 RepID=I2GV20_HENB6|nr:hypothetical protein TBLA_0A01720 [Tetrapisispora blattae CBS 6284]CCH57972.1 hypothetical protein TBLA_0A01720 [Tetrapisispora blattae CBS 6284]